MRDKRYRSLTLHQSGGINFGKKENNHQISMRNYVA